MIEVTTTIQVPLSRVVDLLTTGLEGGFSSWLGGLDYIGVPKAEYETYAKYAQEVFWVSGGTMLFHFEDGDNKACAKPVGQAQLAEALNLMASQQTATFADFLAESEDAITGDVFLQLLCLGEVIYG